MVWRLKENIYKDPLCRKGRVKKRIWSGLINFAFIVDMIRADEGAGDASSKMFLGQGVNLTCY